VFDANALFLTSLHAGHPLDGLTLTVPLPLLNRCPRRV
jgi:hypothetical protein